MTYILFIIIMICVISAFICHFSIEITEYSIQSNKIDKEFDNFKILQLSDLHNREFGKASQLLLSKIHKINPDIIIITGDLFDKSSTGIEKMLNLIREITKKYPSYFVTGNHELTLGRDKLHSILTKLSEYNVKVLNNEYVPLSNNVYLYGIGYNLITNLDNKFKYTYKECVSKEEMEKKLQVLDKNKFNILLAHNPFSFSAYSNTGFDLIFSGHVHGGIIRLPLIGGLLSPQRKIFPKYSEGIYKMNKSKMIVSRGLGYTSIKFRLFNRPELIVVTLKTDRKE